MARARSLKPGFFRNADLVELPMEARLLFAGLWILADREGRLEDRPKQIKMDIFPADSLDCDVLIGMLAATNMVIRYQAGGKRYLQVTNFAKHQNPHRDEKPSNIPAPVLNEAESKPTPMQHSANTVLAQCKDDADTVAIGLTPDSLNLTPDSRLPEPDSLTNTHSSSLAHEAELPPTSATVAGAVCVVLKSHGVGNVNPSHPDLLAMIAAGADFGQFSEAAKLAVCKKIPTFAYVLGIVRRQLEDVAQMAASPPEKPSGYETPYQRSMREKVAAFAPAIAKKAPGETEKNLIVLDHENVSVD